MIKLKKYRFICLLLCCFSLALSAENRYKFRTLSPDGGFYYDGVKEIIQDNSGFIWIMMEYGLYRFDGYAYKNYQSQFLSMQSSHRLAFRDMAADTQGSLLISTDNGLYKRDPLSDNFIQIYDTVSAVETDGRNRLWIYKDNLWQLLDIHSGTCHPPLYDGSSAQRNNALLCIAGNEVYSFIGQKIYHYNEQDGQFKLCYVLPGAVGDVRFAQVTGDALWVFANHGGLYQINCRSFKLEKYFTLPDFFEKLTLRALYVDMRKCIWLGTLEGMYVFHPEDGTWEQYRHIRTDPFSLPNNSVWTIYGDRQSNIWIGTYSGKLCYVNIGEGNAFRSWTPNNSGLSHVPVSAFAEDGETLWIGTEGGGLFCMNWSTRRIEPFTDPGGTTFNNVKSLLIDPKHNLWISTFREGVDMYDIRQKKMVRYRHRDNDDSSLLVNSVRKIILEADSGLWVAYQYPWTVISYFSFRTRQFSHYTLGEPDNNYLFDLQRQGEDTLWAVSRQALYCMDIHTHVVKKMQPSDSACLGISTFCSDDSGCFWLGTLGYGLVHFDPTISEFRIIDDIRRQGISSIYTICHDRGNIWLGTDHGLYCYDIASGRVSRFDSDENTQGQVYYPLASLKGQDGKLYFGGTNGFTQVDSRVIVYNTTQPRAVISDFFINHEPVQPNYEDNAKLKTIILNYDQPNFGFRFSSDNYFLPLKNRFRYRLKGYSNDWITVNADNRTAMYSEVPAGTYYFEVYAANNDGVWSEEPAVIKIVRKAAPWFSVPAYLFYLLVIAAGVYAVYRHFSEKKRFKLLLYQESLERDKKEQIHQAQLRFFTNISHDFRTPLSLILAALNKLRREGLKEYDYRILNNNAQRLLNLVNELMDFRTIENGMMKLELEPLDINRIVADIGNDFQDYAKEHHIDFGIDCDVSVPVSIYADKNVVEKVVMNLLNNAFKYTRDGGIIRLRTRKEGDGFESSYKNSFTVGQVGVSTFCLIVSDTGVGISRESIANVFERFYKVNTTNTDSHLGTGIGLALVKSLVLLHKGSITIYSERNKGTDMVVRLPLDNTLFSEKDFKQLYEEGVSSAEETIELTADASVLNKESTAVEDKKKILLVEDNSDLRSLITEALSEDFLVTPVEDGLEALDKMEDIDFDLVISDIMMPHKDGVSLCHDIKNNVNTSHIPVVLLTAKTSLESKMEGAESGADLYFEKPIDLNYLKMSLLNIFRNRQLVKEHYAKNYYADPKKLATNEQDNKFLKQFIDFVDNHIACSDLNVNQIAEALCMSRSKLYVKVKSLTGKTVVEFVLNYRLRKAARLIVEESMPLRVVMEKVGIESPSYFTNSFKKVFGETPSAFADKHHKQ